MSMISPHDTTTVKELQDFLAWHLEKGGKETDRIMICDDSAKPTWFDTIPLGYKFERLKKGTTAEYEQEDIIMLIPTRDPNGETLNESSQRAAQ